MCLQGVKLRSKESFAGAFEEWHEKWPSYLDEKMLHTLGENMRLARLRHAVEIMRKCQSRTDPNFVAKRDGLGVIP